jgi:hypothetical protein
MIVEFLEEATEELIEAALWYEAKEPGLGVRFRDEKRSSLPPLPMNTANLVTGKSKSSAYRYILS